MTIAHVEFLKPETNAIRVNGVEITHHAIASEMQYHPAGTQQIAYQRAAQALVIKELLLQEAARLKLEVEYGQNKKETREEILIRRLIDRAVRTPEPDEHSCRTYFQNNRDRFKTPDLIVVSHILLACPKDDAKRRRTAALKAKELLTALRKGTSFAKLAKSHSACPSSNNRGSLGQLTPGHTVPEFERQVFPLPEGLASHPIETRYGYHIVHIDRKVSGRRLDYQPVRVRIQKYLTAQVKRKAISQYISHLAGQAKLEGINLDQTGSHLLQ